jgi:hypothetical protein
MLRITNKTEEEMSDDREDDGKIVFQMEPCDNSLPWNRCNILPSTINITRLSNYNYLHIPCLSQTYYMPLPAS